MGDKIFIGGTIIAWLGGCIHHQSGDDLSGNRNQPQCLFSPTYSFPRFCGQFDGYEAEESPVERAWFKLGSALSYLLLDANLSSPAGNGTEVANPGIKTWLQQSRPGDLNDPPVLNG